MGGSFAGDFRTPGAGQGSAGTEDDAIFFRSEKAEAIRVNFHDGRGLVRLAVSYNSSADRAGGSGARTGRRMGGSVTGTSGRP